jgi:glutathione S-transferase
LRGISEATEQHFIELKKSLSLFDTFLTDDGYAAANYLTIADLSLITRLTSIIITEYDLSDYPKVKQWLVKMQELPYFEEINGKVINEFRKRLGK